MGRIFDALKAAASEIQLSGPLGTWAQRVSLALDDIATALGIAPGGGASAAELDILGARRAGLDQNGVGGASDIILNNTVFIRGTGITYDFNTGIYTLTPGKVYELDAGGAVGSFSDAAAGFLEIAWVDANLDTPLSTNMSGIYKPSTQTNASSNGGRTRALFIPTGAGDSQVKLRCVAATGTASIPAGYFASIVKQLR